MKIILPCLITTALAAVPELVTTLDQNMICFLHMYGLRSGTRALGDGYLFGFYDDKEAKFIPFVKTVNNNSTVLYGPSDLIELTSVSSHAPKYEPDVDYCKQAEEQLAAEAANGSVVPNTAYIIMRDHSDCVKRKQRDMAQVVSSVSEEPSVYVALLCRAVKRVTTVWGGVGASKRSKKRVEFAQSYRILLI